MDRAVIAKEASAPVKSRGLRTDATRSGSFARGFVIAAPLAAYEALELYKGLSPDGGIIDYPLVQLTIQLIGKKDAFSPELAQKSREYFFQNLDRIVDQLKKEESKVDSKWWVQIPDTDKAEYEVLMQEARNQLKLEGYYDPDMLDLLRKVRCKLDQSRPECTG